MFDGSSVTSFINVNLTTYKMYVYNMKGMLKFRSDFNDIVEKYGVPNTVSNNGRIYIFYNKAKCRFNVLNMTLEGFEFVKSIDFITCIKSYVQNVQLNNFKDIFNEENEKFR